MTLDAAAVLLLLITNTLAQSSEETLAPAAHVNFNEIFTNSLSMLNDDSLSTVTKEDEFHLGSMPNLGSMPSVDTDFHHPNLPNLSGKKLVLPTRRHTPEPRFPTPSYLKIIKTTPEMSEDTTVRNIDVKTTKKSTTKMIKYITTKRLHVLPLKHERGVLDILFPAARVKNFKYVFNSFKRVLSYTF